MLASRVLRNAYTRRMMAELARKGELLGPRPKLDPATKRIRRETIQIAPPSDSRDASLFFHTGQREREGAPVVQVSVDNVVSRMQLKEVERVVEEGGIRQKEEKHTHTTETTETTQTTTTTTTTHHSDTPDQYLFAEFGAQEITPRPVLTLNKPWILEIHRMLDEDSPMIELQNHITHGVRKGYILPREMRGYLFTCLYAKNKLKTVVSLSHKLNCIELTPNEFAQILSSAVQTNQWRAAYRLMNRNWDLVEVGPPTVSLTALKVFINTDFSIARSFVHQLMQDKRFCQSELEQVVYVYLHGARTVALNLEEMMRFATQYQKMPFMEKNKIMKEMARGFHQLGSAKQVKIFQSQLCTRGLDKIQGVKEAMFLRYLYLGNFKKARHFLENGWYHKHRAVLSGYMALVQRSDWDGVLQLHDINLVARVTPVKHSYINCALIEAVGATLGMDEAIEQAKKHPVTPQTVVSLFKVYCLHYPEQAGDLERLLSSPGVSEVRQLTKNLDLKNLVPMMLLNTGDIRNAVSIAAFQQVHLKRRRTIEALVKLGKPERAFKFYTLLIKTEIPLSEHDYFTMIRGLCKKNFLELAEELYEHLDKAIPVGTWRKRICRLDIALLRSKRADMSALDTSTTARAILMKHIKYYCREKLKRESSVLASPKYTTMCGYEWVAIAKLMVEHGLFSEARELLTRTTIELPMAYALLAECHARLGSVSEIRKMIKDMKASGVRADQTYKALSSLTEYQYGTGLTAVLEQLKVMMDARHTQAVEEQVKFLEVLVSGVDGGEIMMDDENIDEEYIEENIEEEVEEEEKALQ